ncbi:hypothetical protein NE237_022115 [Protea cynaroides]|uniref:G-patch domain-containing protein n=1 Tax=Protea cynaroides TaxID=273540 RepID=A0A9Q0K3W8_9MAGN|nr:hypothetical protein NE237_022115 [Protea cynaroides]
MKLSFSLSSKSSSKPIQHKPAENFKQDNSKDGGEIKHEYVTEFEPSKSLNRSEKLVIPPKPNEWRPLKKMKNLDLPSADDPGAGFEVEAPLTAGIPDSGMSYGLNVRQANRDDKDKMEVDPPARSGPGEDLTLQRFKEDMKNLPDDRGFDEFVDVPIEGFGAALLAGYGWHEGRGIGRNAKEDVKVVQYNRRIGMTGLGFAADMPEAKNHQSDSNAQNVPQKGPNEQIERLHARVNDMPATRELRAQELKDGRNREERRDHRSDRANSSRGKDSKRKDDERGREKGRRGEELRHGNAYHSNGHREEERRTKKTWLTSHIRVRIVSKDFRGGKLYLKKGEVVDVVGPTTCDIAMDENRELIQGVDQEILETALPRRGGPVLVLHGKHKGVFGSLVERNIEKETGIIQDADAHALLNVRLDQIAEYLALFQFISNFKISCRRKVMADKVKRTADALAHELEEAMQKDLSQTIENLEGFI